MMDFDRIYFVSNKLLLAEADDLLQLEQGLGVPLPLGYADFMQKLGVGTYCDFLRVFSPDQILERYQDARERWRTSYFWDAGRDVLSKEQVLESIIFADTTDGDEIIFHPQMPDKLFVLPRHDDQIYWVHEVFMEPLNWDSVHGKMYESPSFRHFESWVDRAAVSYFTQATDIDLDELMEGIAAHWTDMLIDEMDEEDQVRLLFVPSIDGRLQLVQAAEDDPRVGVRLDYDVDFEEIVGDFGAWLGEQGFAETWHSEDGE